MGSYTIIHTLLRQFQPASPRRSLTESGVAGADRIQRQDIERVFTEYMQTILQKYDKFVSAQLSGSVSNPQKTDFGDLDVLVHLRGENKKDAKEELVNYLMTFPDTVFGVFKNPKYLTRRFYNSGEIVSVRYLYDNGTKSVQIDNTISLSATEMDFKKRFLDFPAEKQGLILGLVKVAFMEEPAATILRRLNLRPKQQLQPGQEWEFNLSSAGLTLRLVTLDAQRKELAREDVWKTDDWSYVEKLLASYDLSQSFEDLYELIKTRLKNPRSKQRVVGLFKSMVSVKSGEVGTEKGAGKLRNIEKMAKLLDTQP